MASGDDPPPLGPRTRTLGGVRSITVAAETHILELAADNGIRLTWTNSWDQAEAFPLLSEAVVPRITTGGDYLICLHELGHCLAPGIIDLEMPSDTPRFASLASEGLAWAWAASEAAQSLLEPGDWEAAVAALGSHYRRLPTAPGDRLPTSRHPEPCHTQVAYEASA